MIDRCVCYVIDRGYTLPALSSAVQARANSNPAQTDVVIVCVDPDREAKALLERVCAAEGIRLVVGSRQQIGDMHMYFARLFLDRLLPDDYREVLYLDGDTSILGSLDPILHAETNGKVSSIEYSTTHYTC